jgi:hypothetical protein
MKSLERLNKIEEHYQKLIIDLYLKSQISKWEKDAIYDKYKDDFEQIKQDLEVLEIIKKKKVEVFPLFFIIRTSEEESDEYILMKYNTRFNNKLYELTMEELLKLKQWLEVNNNEN